MVTPIDPLASLTAMHDTLRARIETLSQSEDETKLKALARLVESVVRISGEVRQIEKQNRRDLAKYTTDQIIAHVLMLDDKQQKTIADAILRDARSSAPLFG